MPLYEYQCRACDAAFEALVRSGEVPDCPTCGGSELDRLVSTPALKSEATRSQAMRAAKRRDKRQAKDRVSERLRYEKSHDRHG